MKNYKITIQYDGSKFYGFQRQKRARTVQSVTEDALSELFKEKVVLKGCGRTDRGVHAYNHASNFNLLNDIKIPFNKLAGVITSKLPKDVVCLDICEVPLEFHSRFSAKLREYMYIIDTSGEPSAFCHQRAWRLNEKLPIRKLRKTLAHVVGEHDFTSFCANIAENPNRVRRITKIKVKKNKNKIFINIQGYAFLHKMIRLIVGTAVEIALSNESHKRMRDVLLKKEKTPYRISPAQGLYLYKITY